MPSSERILNTVLQEVEFDRQDNLQWDPELGFAVHPATDEDFVHVAGFAAPYLPGGEKPVPDTRERTHPLTVYADLPDSLRNLNHQSKGVGTRLYNNLNAARSGIDVTPADGRIGVYGVALDRARILDLRSTQGGRLRQIVRHAGQRALGALGEATDLEALQPEAVVERVHSSYGNAEVVRMNIPPRGQLDMARKGLAAPAGVEHGFMILRSPRLTLVRIGSAALAR